MHDTVIAAIGLFVTALWIMLGLWCSGGARRKRTTTTIELGPPRDAVVCRFGAFVLTCSHPRIVPIDAHWAQCTLCGDDTFPADGAVWGEIE